MSNRNFDASLVAKRLRDQNVAQQLYGSFTNGRAPGNPQTTSTQVSIIATEYYPGVQTTVEQSLQGSVSFNPGGIANYVPDPNAGPVGPTATVPTAPTIDSIIRGNSAATVNFTAGSDGGSPIVDYEYAIDSGSGFGSWISAATTTSPITITGLTNGTTYQVKIRAVNAVGAGAESNIDSVTPATTPSAPLNLTVIPSIGLVYLYFTAPSDDGGEAITNYQYSTDNGSSWSYAGTTSSPITISGLVQNGTVYTIKLRAVNSVDPGTESSSVDVASLSTFSPSDIANLNVWLDSQQPGSVVLSSNQVTAWNDSSIVGNNFTKGPSGTITYDFPSGINNRPALNFTTSAPSTQTYLSKSFNISSTNQMTTFLVVRQTGTGASGNSELLFSLTNYNYMDIFNRTMGDGTLAMNMGSGTQVSTGVDIITSPPTNAIISFVADSTVDMFVNGSATSVSGTARGGLSLNTALEWAVSAGAFLGNYGELITYSVPLTTLQRQQVEGYLAWKWGMQDSLPVGHPYRSAPPSVTVPDTPTGLSATPGNTTASISFTPGSDGGSPITNYKYSTNGTTYTALSPADTSSPITITGLTNGVTYNITLKAVNAIGDSVASTSVSVTPASSISGNINMILLGDASVTTVRTSIINAKTALGYGGTLTITAQQLNGYTGSDLSTYDMALIYTNGGLSLNATLGDNLDAFVTSGKHLIMMTFAWGNVSAISNFDYANNSTYEYKGTQTLVSTGTVTFTVTHPITTGLSTSTGVSAQNIPSPITLTSSATSISEYSNATSFIAVKTQGSANLVGINSYPFAFFNYNYIVNSMFWCMGYLD